MIETKSRKISLKGQDKAIVEVKKQLAILEGELFESDLYPKFSSKLKVQNNFPLKVKKLEIFQVNIGYMCNQVCEHCHVDAGPDRKEIMTKDTMKQCLEAIEKSGAHTVDITGGAPEMNPDFRWFIEELTKIGVDDIIVRSNLTIIVANKKYRNLPEFFKANNIHLISSLPCYTVENVDKQRGDGVFNASIEALKMLNRIGYGVENSGLKLDLVFNPGGASLPGNQQTLEFDYKRELQQNFGITFNQLFTITNLPISRFLDFLVASERFEEYMEKLITSYNPYTVENLMCRNTISVSWEGDLYDCDFNQMLELKTASSVQHIADFNLEELRNRDVVISQHCYGCTAGAGSSCQGTVA
jgi:radical SAM/Cys-rich protein